MDLHTLLSGLFDHSLVDADPEALADALGLPALDLGQLPEVELTALARLLDADPDVVAGFLAHLAAHPASAIDLTEARNFPDVLFGGRGAIRLNGR